MNLLIGLISVRTFHDGGSAGFYYENPANGVSDDGNFVRARVSESDSFLIDDGGNDDDRGHDNDDHDYHGSLYYLHGDEGDYGNDDQGDDDCKSRDSVYHLCTYLESDAFHGHNDDDHDSRVDDDDGKGNHDEETGRVRIDHGNCNRDA